MWITKTSVNQPVFATMVMLALVVLGLFSYRLLPVEQMPEVARELGLSAAAHHADTLARTCRKLLESSSTVAEA